MAAIFAAAEGRDGRGGLEREAAAGGQREGGLGERGGMREADGYRGKREATRLGEREGRRKRLLMGGGRGKATGQRVVVGKGEGRRR